MTVLGVTCATLIILVLAGSAFQGRREGHAGAVGRRKRGQVSTKGPTATALRREMKTLARPTLLLLPTDASVFSKLGGAPQLDTDAGLKTRWGDGGRLYYWIREADARAGDFSKIQMVGQDY